MLTSLALMLTSLALMLTSLIIFTSSWYHGGGVLGQETVGDEAPGGPGPPGPQEAPDSFRDIFSNKGQKRSDFLGDADVNDHAKGGKWKKNGVFCV